MQSETSKRRAVLAPFCRGIGVDIGYGGDPIKPSAVTIDLPRPYSHVGDHPLNLAGDARQLHWFRNGVLDYVFSSHLLEDFEDPLPVLVEWTRVLKKDGVLVLLLPDEQIYRQYCADTGQAYNVEHKNPDLSLDNFCAFIDKHLDGLLCIHSESPVAVYSFEVVFRKLKEKVRRR